MKYVNFFFLKQVFFTFFLRFALYFQNTNIL